MIAPHHRKYFKFFGVVVVVSCFLIGFSLRKLDSTEYGLQYDKNAKVLSTNVKEGGLHAGPPGFEFVKFPSTYITTRIPQDIADNPDEYERLGMCVSRDGLRVKINVEFQYQMAAESVAPATKRFRSLDRWSKIVETMAVSAVQRGCSQFDTSSFQNERGTIQSVIFNSTKFMLDKVYARAVGLQLAFVELPQEYSTAVAAKQSANEDIELAINERKQSVVQAETLLQTAMETAKQINDTALNNKNLLIAEAKLEAQSIAVQYAAEAKVCAKAKDALALTSEGLLSYMGNRALQSAQGDVQIALTEFAGSTYRDEL